MDKEAQFFLDRSDKDFEAHGESLGLTVRIVSIVNGGAALALLGLLGQLLTSENVFIIPDLNTLVLEISKSIGIFCIGLLTAGIAPIIMGRGRHRWGKYNYKYFEFLSDPENNKKPEKETLGAIFTRISYATIALGCLCFVLGVWRILSAFVMQVCY